MFEAPALETSLAKPSQKAKPALPRGYIALWAGLTGIATLYIAHIGLEATGNAGLMATQDRPVIAEAVAQEKALQAEVETLRHHLETYQRDLAQLRTGLETAKPDLKQDASSLATLSALEERMSMTTGIAVAKAEVKAPEAPAPAVQTAMAPATAPSAFPQAPAATAPQNVPGVSAAAALEAWTGKPATATPSAVPKVISAVRPTPTIETGSIASETGKMAGQLPKAPASTTPAPAAHTAPAAAAATTASPADQISFGPAVVKAEPKPYAVQLASGSSIDDIRASWMSLSIQNGDTLGKLAPRVAQTESETAGTTYDLLAGPVKTAAEARKICKALAARGTDCKVTPYTGEAF